MHHSVCRILVFHLCLVFYQNTLQAYELLYELVCPEPQTNANFGRSLAGDGDVNGDGYADIVVGAPHFNLGGGLGDAGKVFVYSGRTGTLLYSLTSPNAEPSGSFGSSVAIVKDINNDNADDVIVGAPNEDPEFGLTDAGRVYVICGQTGIPLRVIVSPNAEIQGKFGFSVDAAGDMNLDGYEDILVGAADETSGGLAAAGRVYAMSGETGLHLKTFESPNAKVNGHFGFAIACAGYTNDDMYPDVIIGAPFESNPNIPEYTGRAYLFDGNTGAVRFSFHEFGSSEDDYFGWSVDGGRDSNDDGYDDVVVGAPGTDNPLIAYAYNTGWVFRMSGLTGTLLPVSSEIFEFMYGYSGLSVACVDDYNLDGLDDVAFGIPGPGEYGIHRGSVDIISAETGLGFDWPSPPTNAGVEWFGDVLADVGDVNNDWYSEIAIASYRADTIYEDAGRVWVFGPDLPTIAVSSRILGMTVELSWDAVQEANEYWIYGAENEPFFEPQPESPFNYRIATTSNLSWLSIEQTGDETSNWTYLVVAVNDSDLPLCKSNRVGEFDRNITIP